MICKKDITLWFKELESYKRIDMMCTLLNMCLPFELRFLGTCLEELGRRDSQELRGIELRVNNPQDLAIDMMACQKGEPTDKKIRRKMALYLALIRACNRSCVAEIFRTLDGWGEREFDKMNDLDTLEELLLVYTMAANHPVFAFEQHMKCTEIFEKIKENKLVCDQHQSHSFQKQIKSITEKHLHSSLQHQDVRQHLSHPNQQDIMSKQHTLHAIHIAGQQHPIQSSPMPIIPQGSMPVNFSHTHHTKIMPTDGSIQHQITVDGIPHIMSSNVAIPADLAITHPATWAVRSNLQQFGPHTPTSIEQPPSLSPMLSQQSSPSSSRATSPNRTSANVIIQQSVQAHQHSSHHQIRNIPQRVSLKNVRRLSTETTPSPISQTQQQIISTEHILPQSMKQMEDVVINTDGSMTLQTLIRNGFGRNASYHRHKSGNFIPHHQPVTQHFQTMPPGTFTVNTGLSYSMQNISLIEGVGGTHSIDNSLIGQPSNKNGGSDSEGSIGSSAEISPPETPTLITNNSSSQGSIRGNDINQQLQLKPHILNYNKQINLARVNGRTEKMVSGALASSSGIINYSCTSLTNPQPSPLQQQYIGSEIIRSTSGSSSTAGMLQSSLASNNVNNVAITNTGTISVPAVNAVSTNNNMGNTVIISSPSNAGGCGLLTNIITANSAIQQQFNATYPYHSAAVQHLASTTRPPIISHSPGMGPPPPGSFRLPGYQIPPNGEMIFPAYHPTGIAFLSGSVPPGANAVTLRPPTSTTINQPTTNTAQATSPILQQQQQMPPTPSPLIHNASPYTTLTIGINKPISCYNCGSQNHNGRDCHEASMDDVTRSVIYKLDYSVSSSNASSTTVSHPNSSSITVASSSMASSSDNYSSQQIQNLQQQPHIAGTHDVGIATSVSSTIAP